VQIIHKGSLVLAETVEGLARHLKSASLVVGFRQAPVVSEVERLPGVRGVTLLEPTRLRVHHEPGTDPTEAIVALATARGWGLQEIGPERASLEQIFLELTTAESQAPEAAS
jgi:ABC-2 type transport system ATP-binding protein